MRVWTVRGRNETRLMEKGLWWYRCLPSTHLHSHSTAWDTRCVFQVYEVVPCHSDCNQYIWVTEPWSVCKVTFVNMRENCGEGVQTRKVRWDQAEWRRGKMVITSHLTGNNTGHPSSLHWKLLLVLVLGNLGTWKLRPSVSSSSLCILVPDFKSSTFQQLLSWIFIFEIII